MGLQQMLKLFRFKRNWRKMNSHNETSPANLFDPSLVKVGRKTYGVLNVSMFNPSYRLTIGNFCSIGPNVTFLLSSDHYLNHISTFPFKVKYGMQQYEGVSKGDIVLEDDVWIGCGAIILSGVCIGQGAVIAAGAVVTKDIPPYAIVVGCPAKVIRYRFAPEMINRMLQIDYGSLTDEQILEHIDDLYLPADESIIQWMPIKKGNKSCG